MNLSQYNGKRIALVMEVQGREVVLCGATSLRRDRKQGQMLQVTITGDAEAALGSPVFLISEKQWTQRIASGVPYGCDYCLDLSAAAVGV